MIHDSEILWTILFENGKKTGEHLAGAESDDDPPRAKEAERRGLPPEVVQFDAIIDLFG
ncbi:MAG: hypothetical protein HYV63_34770 [Candidatus Schekmanbacteria bacterium]|nr:hypothetical protein [Candidatus Schekmanbacteria bacterium]